MKKFKLGLLVGAISLIVGVPSVMAAYNGECPSNYFLPVSDGSILCDYYDNGNVIKVDNYMTSFDINSETEINEAVLAEDANIYLLGGIFGYNPTSTLEHKTKIILNGNNTIQTLLVKNNKEKYIIEGDGTLTINKIKGEIIATDDEGNNLYEVVYVSTDSGSLEFIVDENNEKMGFKNEQEVIDRWDELKNYNSNFPDTPVSGTNYYWNNTYLKYEIDRVPDEQWIQNHIETDMEIIIESDHVLIKPYSRTTDSIINEDNDNTNPKDSINENDNKNIKNPNTKDTIVKVLSISVLSLVGLNLLLLLKKKNFLKN